MFFAKLKKNCSILTDTVEIRDDFFYIPMVDAPINITHIGEVEGKKIKTNKSYNRGGSQNAAFLALFEQILF